MPAALTETWLALLLFSLVILRSAAAPPLGLLSNDIVSTDNLLGHAAPPSQPDTAPFPLTTTFISIQGTTSPVPMDRTHDPSTISSLSHDSSSATTTIPSVDEPQAPTLYHASLGSALPPGSSDPSPFPTPLPKRPSFSSSSPSSSTPSIIPTSTLTPLSDIQKPSSPSGSLGAHSTLVSSDHYDLLPDMPQEEAYPTRLAPLYAPIPPSSSAASTHVHGPHLRSLDGTIDPSNSSQYPSERSTEEDMFPWRWDRAHFRQASHLLRNKTRERWKAWRHWRKDGSTSSSQVSELLRRKKAPLASWATGVGVSMAIGAALGGPLGIVGASMVGGAAGGVVQNEMRQRYQDHLSGIKHEKPRSTKDFKNSLRYHAQDAILPAIGGAFGGAVGGVMGDAVGTGVGKMVQSTEAKLAQKGIIKTVMSKGALKAATGTAGFLTSQGVQGVVQVGVNAAT